LDLLKYCVCCKYIVCLFTIGQILAQYGLEFLVLSDLQIFLHRLSNFFNWEVVTSHNFTSIENRGHDPCAEVLRCEATVMFFSLVNEHFLTRVSLELVRSGSEQLFVDVALECVR